MEEHSLTAAPAARWLLSTTIPANTTMLRMFGRLGYQVQCEVDVWPGWVLLGVRWGECGWGCGPGWRALRCAFEFSF